MTQTIATWLSWLLAGYLTIGLLVAVPFVIRGVDRIDPAARGAGWGFRLIIVPGTIALWPLLVLRWAGRREPPQERNAHRNAACGRKS